MHSVAFGDGDRKLVAACEHGSAWLWNLPEPMLHRGRVEVAVRLLAFAERFWIERFGALDDDRRYLLALHDAARETLDAERVAALG